MRIDAIVTVPQGIGDRPTGIGVGAFHPSRVGADVVVESVDVEVAAVDHRPVKVEVKRVARRAVVRTVAS